MNDKTYEYTFYDALCAEDGLRYGEIVVDEMYDTWRNTYRLRVVKYEDKLYWHKMVDGKVVDFRELR